jgi:hypothetical protein
MDRAFAMKWADDLETEGLKQARKVLFDGEGYCCLGRACIIAGVEFIPMGEPSKTWITKDEDNNYAVLPEYVRDKLGMADSDGSRRDGDMIVINDKSFTSLAGANDGGTSFKEIAAYIRENWEQL